MTDEAPTPKLKVKEIADQVVVALKPALDKISERLDALEKKAKTSGGDEEGEIDYGG